MSSSKIFFLSVAEIIAIHKDQISSYGGKLGIRDQNLLESAAFAPQTSLHNKFVHKSLYAMAAAYAYHLIKNHPFFDGNKRTGMASMLVFLDLNEIAVTLTVGQIVEVGVLIAIDRISREELAKILQGK